MNRSRLALVTLIFLGLLVLIGKFFNQEKVWSFKKVLSGQSNLDQVISQSLDGTTGTYSVVVKNLKTGEKYGYNQDKVYKSGSLYKLWVMAAAFQQIQQGQLKEDEEFSDDIAALNQKFGIDPDLAEQTSGVITLTTAQALNQMVVISHNYAALLLTDRVKLSFVADFLKQNNFNSSKVGIKGEGAETTAADIALFLEKLYKGELSTLENSQKMLELLKKQQLNDKLPKYLPENTVVAHKTGEIDYLSHDAGIVYTPKGDYIIVVMSESGNPAGAEERIAQISKAVYDYFDH